MVHDAYEAVWLPSMASIPPCLSNLQPALWPSRNTNGSTTSSGSHPNLKWNLALQCEHFGKSVTKTIRSESVNSHWSALIPAACAARAMKPKWRRLAKLCTCSTQMPVKVATSESVKIFWLDFTVTMAPSLLFRSQALLTLFDAASSVRDATIALQ